MPRYQRVEQSAPWLMFLHVPGLMIVARRKTNTALNKLTFGKYPLNNKRQRKIKLLCRGQPKLISHRKLFIILRQVWAGGSWKPTAMIFCGSFRGMLKVFANQRRRFGKFEARPQLHDITFVNEKLTSVVLWLFKIHKKRVVDAMLQKVAKAISLRWRKDVPYCGRRSF